LLLYLLFSPKDEKPTQVAEQPKATEQPTQTQPTTAPVGGPNQEVLNNVDALLNSFPPNLKLSVVRYSEGEFIIESHAKSKDLIDQLNSRIKQVLQKGQIKESKETKSPVSGDQIGITAGFVPQSSIWSRPDQLDHLSYVGESELKDRIRNYAQANNLKLEDYNVGRTRKENNFQKTMIKLQVVGDRDAATSLLKKLNDDRINVSFSKIAFVAERTQKSNDVTLTVHIELFKKIA
jgi:hypothetical protein